MRISQIETPALIVDLDVMEGNMARMKELLKPLGAALRPHYKSNKCTAIVKKQLAGGGKVRQGGRFIIDDIILNSIIVERCLGIHNQPSRILEYRLFMLRRARVKVRELMYSS